MDGNKCVLQLRGLRPFLSPKYYLRKHPNFKYTEEADKNNAFDTAKLISAKLTVKPNDMFTVYETEEQAELTEEDKELLNFDDLEDPDLFE
jgi:type IV secretion system protein VirD4